MTLDDWVRSHAFLAPMARLRTRIDAAIADAAPPHPAIPDWNTYRANFHSGVPLLHCAETAIDLDSAGEAIAAVIRSLGGGSLDGALADDLRELARELPPGSAGCRRIVGWLLGDDGWTPARPGTLRYVGWLTMAEALRPLTVAFDEWRDDDRWLRRYCPLCAAAPAMAYLTGTDPGRRRYLSCGRCGTRWRYGRTDCPFCEVKSDRLASLEIDGEAGLRIVYCDSCRGYLKTYSGQGAEGVLLADWTSLHLDLAARDRGLQPAAASLYEFENASAS